MKNNLLVQTPENDGKCKTRFIDMFAEGKQKKDSGVLGINGASVEVAIAS